MSESNDPSPYGPSQQPPAYGQLSYGQYGQPVGRDPESRPGTVTAAGIITLVLSGIGLLLFAAVAIGLAVARDDVVDSLSNEQGLEDISPDDLVTILIVATLVLVVWCIAAMVLAVLAMRRSQVARILLVISAVMAALLSLLAITSLVSGVTLIGAVAVVVLLFVGGAGDWYSSKGNGPQLPIGTTQPWG